MGQLNLVGQVTFVLLLIVSPQQPARQEKVAVVLGGNVPPIILPRSEAEALYERLKNGSDPKMFAALTIALGTVSDQVAPQPMAREDFERKRWHRLPLQQPIPRDSEEWKRLERSGTVGLAMARLAAARGK